ncbi:MAG TPA: flagellar basal-body P-ring protein, partial [Isosphaeraceae bacterium]|nr:flagellar basal-body P-ring protein [Isosphaeraceae bacterium]
PDDLRQGRVLGGAKIKLEEVPYALVLKENRRSVKNAGLISGIVGQRFFYLDGVNQKSMAQTKATDQYLALKVPRNYHQNQARYFQVLQLLPVVDTPDLRADRLERWGKELLDPKTCGQAAMKLEGMGRNAVDTLKTGLDHENPLVRYFSAEALAYLNDGSGADELMKVVTTWPEFRAFALAALAASDQASTLTKLRDLMANPDPEIRYGAFNALKAADEENSYLGKVRILKDRMPEPPDDPNSDEAMAFQIAMARAVRARASDPFSLYLVDCEGPPMIHVSNTRRCEIVVFGDRQRLLPPVVLGSASSVLLNASQGDNSVQIARISPEALDQSDTKINSSLDLGEVIKEAANLGATYPQIVEILRMADRQKNLEGPLVVDAIPEPVSDYDKAQLAGVDPKSKTDKAVKPAKAEPEPRRFHFFDRFRRHPDR